MTTPPAPSDELETRVAELATGFALGELDERELHEFYELLRDHDGQGPQVARIAWRTLSMVTDLRAEVSQGFQDSLRLRLGQERSGRFRNRLWSRLGFNVPGLEPVEAPAPSRGLAIAAWAVVVGLAVTLLVGGAVLALARERPARATVVRLLGGAECAGRALVPDSVVDGRPLIIKPGGQLTLRWDDGSNAIISGGENGDDGAPAEAVVRAQGLVLNHGRAWVTAHRGFALILPGRSCSALVDETTVALEAVGGQGFIGVRHGQLRADGVDQALGDNAGVGPAGSFSWLWEWDAATGALSAGRAAPADWRLGAEVYWSDPTDSARLVLAAGDAETVSLLCSPGLLVVQVGGHEVQRISVPGSPLLGYRLELRQRQRRSLAITIADQTASVSLPQPADRYRLSATPGANFKITAFYPLPDPRPPQGAAGW
jgi:hypothetical protein